MWSLFKKEINSFFSGVLGYVVVFFFLAANGLLLWVFKSPVNLLEGNYATLNSLFMISPWIFLFLVPAISMRMFAEEKRLGTLELLLIRPVNEYTIVLAKFLAVWVLAIVAVLPTLIYYYSMWKLGSPAGNIDTGGTWGSYIGLLMLAGIYASIGVFSSSLTDNQAVAFVLAVVMTLSVTWGFDQLATVFGSGSIEFLVSKFGILFHYESISRGVLDSRDLVYFLGIMALFLLATRLVLQRRRQYGHLMAGMVLVVLLNIISGFWFFRADLTSEKRYTLSDPTKTLLKNLDDFVYVQVYLDGELPPEFISFKQNIRELLDEFRAFGGEHIQYDFINVYEEANQDLRERMITDLYERGLQITNIQMRDREGGKSDRIIFPGAIISYKGYEIPVNLLRNNPALPHEVNLNNSIQTLEYEFIRAIQSLTLTEIPKIAFIEGHGELDSLQTHSIMDALKSFFQVDRGYINGNLEALMDYEALIIARPMRPFSQADKFAIDQYIMRGGKVLFFLDPVSASPDSLQSGMTLAMGNPVDIEDLLFRYGIRIDFNLAVDMQCNYVPVNVAAVGEQAQFRMMPWIYLPLLSGPQNHPVTRGLNYVKSEFATVLDTLEGTGGSMKKTALLTTSPNSMRLRAPLQIRMEEITRELNPSFFTLSHQPIGILLEGTFDSFYKNYAVPEGVYPRDVGILPVSQPAKVFVSGDADLIRNEVEYSGGRFRAQALGYDKYTRQTFGNKEFILNLVNYMTDDTGIMTLRSREFKLRLLNQEVLNDKGKRSRWIILNTVIPALLLVLFGLLFTVFRKRKYAAK